MFLSEIAEIMAVALLRLFHLFDEKISASGSEGAAWGVCWKHV